MRAVGIILAGGNSNKMRELTHKRAVAAMPIAGSYRAIDFALSNMSNSHIQKVAVLTQYNARSLNEHLNSSKWWDFGRKQGGLYVFTPTITAENGYWYRGTADAIYQNLDFLKRCHEPYVIITSGDAVYKMDYNKVLEYHIAKKADITVVCKELGPNEDASRFGTIKMNDSMRIEEFEEKPMVAQSQIVSTGIYVIRRRQLIDLIERCAEDDRHDFVTDILIRYKNLKKIYGYKIKDYWSNISTVDAYYQTNMDFLKKSHEPYVVIASGDAVYKMDYSKVLQYHIDKKADVTVVCKEMDPSDDVSRFGTIRMDDDMRITEFEEKPMVTKSNMISTGIYVIRRRLLIDLIEHAAEEERFDFVNDVLIRYKNLKKIYGYKIDHYWSNIATVDAYYKTNMDFLKPEVRNYFFKQDPEIYSKVSDLPPAKYNPGASVKNSLVGSGSIINGTVENSVIFKQVFVGNNCVIKNSIILNDVYLGDNTYIENCIVESRDTIRANTRHVGTNGIKVVVEKNERYAL